MKFTAIVQHFYPQRRKYLERIVSSIEQADPARILLWNNSGDLFRLEGVDIIGSPFNTLSGRYAAAFLAETPLVYIQDDDLIVEPQAIEEMLQCAADRPEVIVGAFGSNLQKWSERPYTKGERARRGACDVALGRAFACNKRALLPGFAALMRGEDFARRCDDIFFSLHGMAYCADIREYQNLDEEGIGLSHEPEHMSERDRVARELSGLR